MDLFTFLKSYKKVVAIFILLLMAFILGSLMCSNMRTGQDRATVRYAANTFEVNNEKGGYDETFPKQKDFSITNAEGCFFMSLVYVALLDRVKPDKENVRKSLQLIGSKYILKNCLVVDRMEAYRSICNLYNLPVDWPKNVYIVKQMGFAPYHFVVARKTSWARKAIFSMLYDPSFSLSEMSDKEALELFSLPLKRRGENL